MSLVLTYIGTYDLPNWSIQVQNEETLPIEEPKKKIWFARIKANSTITLKSGEVIENMEPRSVRIAVIS